MNRRSGYHPSRPVESLEELEELLAEGLNSESRLVTEADWAALRERALVGYVPGVWPKM
ncbi:MAG: hypothetical protein HC927_09640 [Deltaproteobacteria bacterium]|nr:hypothetical protein [Deltaproteobacteria bacterium]